MAGVSGAVTQVAALLFLDGMNPEILKHLASLPEAQQVELLKLLERYQDAEAIEKARSNFLPFVEATWPGFISGRHFKITAEAFDRVVSGKCRRLIINMPPRHGKSQTSSVRLPAFFLGKNPNGKIIAASHTADLAVGFGRQVRDLVASEEYQKIFPGTSLRSDVKAAGRWSTNAGGEYHAIGVGGALAGRGADLAIIDDSLSERDAMSGDFNPEIWESLAEWFNTGPRQRLQPGGRIVIVETRWNKKDLSGQLIAKASKLDNNASEWEVIEFPAIMPSGKPLWPEYWSLEELDKVKADIPLTRWQAQYQQNPTSEEGAIVKRNMWKRWEEDKPPKIKMVMQSWDTAYEAKQRSDYSACTTWGVFERTDPDGKIVNHLYLMDAWRDKLEFPALKKKVKEMYRDFHVDTLIIEAKAVGAPLVYELRALGIPVSSYTPTKGNDKVVRINAIADLFTSGRVWAPDTKWAEEVIEETASFPRGDHDDYVDTLTQALLRFRQGGLVTSSQDDWGDDSPKRKKAAYY